MVTDSASFGFAKGRLAYKALQIVTVLVDDFQGFRAGVPCQGLLTLEALRIGVNVVAVVEQMVFRVLQKLEIRLEPVGAARPSSFIT